ncbi:hypothetical protein A9Q83_10575 [Alphaproteobacteria bacterium 46_93_T64]|nr:hypothetical protein A9Q83_10575 [Alphaproteobacteria bacterium 46_93_T64]
MSRNFFGVRRSKAVFGMILALSLPLTSISVAEEALKGFAKSYMKQVEKALADVEKRAASGDANTALMSLEKAMYQLEKFDKTPKYHDHSRATAARLSISDWGKKLGNDMAAKVSVGKTTKSSVVSSAPAEAPLKSFAKSYMEQTEKHIGAAKKQEAASDTNTALSSLQEAMRQLGKFDRNYPKLEGHSRAVAARSEISALGKRLGDEMTAKITAGKTTASAKKIVKPSSAAPAQSVAATEPTTTTPMKKTVVATKAPQAPKASAETDDQWLKIIDILDEANVSLTRASSFKTYKTVGDISKAFSAFDVALDTSRSALEGYDAAASANKLPTKGRAARYAKEYAQELRYTYRDKKGKKDAYLSKLFDGVKVTIKDSSDALIAAKDQDDNQRSYQAGQAANWMKKDFVQFDLAMKALGEGASEKMKGQANAIEKDRNDVETQIAAIDKSVAEAKEARLAANRFPPGYTKAADETVLAVAEKQFGTEILRSAEIDPWTEKLEAKWINDGWVVGRFKYYSLWLVKEASSGNTLVYSMRFRQKELSPGGWSDVHYFSVGTSYKILSENIDK